MRIRVSVVVDQVGSYGRQVLRGVLAYAGSHSNWDVRADDADLLAGGVRAGEVDGILAQVTFPKMERWLVRCGLPVVNVSNRLAASALPRVINDDAAIGAMAADYFLARGFTNFAYSGLAGTRFSWLRGEAFVSAVSKRGFGCRTVNHTKTSSVQRPVGPWLATLAKPCAVFGADDHAARRAIRDALELGLRVPEDVAVLGVEDDPFQSALASVPLSSIRSGAEKVGYEGARLLDRLLQGRRPPRRPLLVPPLGVVTRRSSDMLAVADPAVANALRFIREHAFEPIRPADVLRSVAVSRRMMEIRFRGVVGRSIGSEILRVRLERAKRLLAERHLTIGEVAEASGFPEPRYLSVWFRKVEGLTPREYRERFRLA